MRERRRLRELVAAGHLLPPYNLAKLISNFAAVVLTRSAVYRTSVCERGSRLSPAARFLIHESPATRIPHWRATMVSGTVLIPTASAPSLPNARISEGVS